MINKKLVVKHYGMVILFFFSILYFFRANKPACHFFNSQ